MSNEEQKPHPSACPCSECKQKSEEAIQHLGDSDFDTSENTSLRKIKPEVAHTLGYTRPKS